MPLLSRDLIHTISRHSNWRKNSVDAALNRNVYNQTTAWKKFFNLFFISLGIGFTIAGILFFFAYNWAELHKFAKLGIIVTLICVTTSFVLFSNFNSLIKNILLTGTAVIVGVLFAVYGQIYQTGANAYDFFLGWTLFITLWVFVSNFAVLWLIYLILLNTTFILYTQQMATHWPEMWLYTLLFILNLAFLIVSLYISTYKTWKVPEWFTNILSLAVVFLATLGISIGIFEYLDRNHLPFLILAVLTSFAFSAGIKYGLKEKNGFYLLLIPFSLIIIISSLLLRLSDGFGMLFIIGIFIIGSVTWVIKNLLSVQKKWKHE